MSYNSKLTTLTVLKREDTSNSLYTQECALVPPYVHALTFTVHSILRVIVLDKSHVGNGDNIKERISFD